MGDKWVEAWSALIRALEIAREAGMTEEEIHDAMDEVFTEAKPGVGLTPRPKKGQDEN